MSGELTDAVERITKLTEQVARNETTIGVCSTGERIAVALVLERPDLMPRGGYTALEAVERLGTVWTKAALVVQRPRQRGGRWRREALTLADQPGIAGRCLVAQNLPSAAGVSDGELGSGRPQWPHG